MNAKGSEVVGRIIDFIEQVSTEIVGMNVDFAAADGKILPDEQIAVLQAISLPLPQQYALRDFEQTNCFWIERRTEGPYIELTHSASGQ